MVEQLREQQLPIEELDPTIWESTADASEKEFFRKTISEDEAEVRQRVIDVQAKAYKAFPYPCIYLFVFVKCRMKDHPMYTVVLEQAKAAPLGSKPKFVDIGCCMGTELRKLLVDGYPSDTLTPNLIGCDLRHEYIEYGHELYQDGPASDKPVPITFLQSDIFDEESPLFAMKGKIDYIFTSSVFHLFDEATQLKMAECLLGLLDLPERGGDEAKGREYILFGTHDGRHQEQVLKDKFGDKRYAHSPKSWTKMWNSILEKKYGEEWVKSRVKQEAVIASVYKFPEGHKYAEFPPYHDFQWSVRITV